MKDNFELQLDKPCHENHEKFSQLGEAAYCSSCRKVVVDFTCMSDKEIIDYFSNKQVNTCGRFHQHQLKSYRLAMPKPMSFSLKSLKLSIVTFVLLLLNRPAEASATIHQPKTEISAKRISTQTNIHNSDSVYVKGRVLENNQGLPGVNVYIKGTDQGLLTDLDGYFKFKNKLKKSDILVFNYIGFERKEVTVHEFVANEIQKEVSITVDLESHVLLMGEVSISGDQMRSKPSFLQRVASWF